MKIERQLLKNKTNGFVEASFITPGNNSFYPAVGLAIYFSLNRLKINPKLSDLA